MAVRVHTVPPAPAPAPAPALVDAAGAPLRRAAPAAVAGAGARGSGPGGRVYTAHHAAAPNSQELGAWHPSLGSADSDWLRERDMVVSRIRDLVRNNGTAAGAVRRYADHVIGSGLRLQARPDWRALGISMDAAAGLARDIETWWRNYGYSIWNWADAARQGSIGVIQRLNFIEATVAGECLVLPLWRPGRGGAWATCFQSVDTDRLSNPMGEPDTEQLRGGVERDADSAATAYHIRRGHPGDPVTWASGASMEWVRVPRETPWGRPQAIHWFLAERPNQTRGKPPFTSIVKRFHMLDTWQDTELAAALLQATLAAVIESPRDPSLVQDQLTTAEEKSYQDARIAFHEQSPVVLGGVRIPVLFPGDRLTFHQATRPAGSFSPFEESILRHLAAGTGQPYEQVAQAWYRTTYSGGRMAMLDAWKGLIAMRELFAAGVCTPMYVCALEEAIDRGDIRVPRGAPDFYEAWEAYTRCKWIGPGRGWVDPVKEAQAAKLRMEFGVSTLEAEAAEQGLDWEEVLEQRELDLVDRLGLPRPAWAQIAGLKPTTDEPAPEKPP